MGYSIDPNSINEFIAEITRFRLEFNVCLQAGNNRQRHINGWA